MVESHSSPPGVLADAIRKATSPDRKPAPRPGMAHGHEGETEVTVWPEHLLEQKDRYGPEPGGES